MTNPDTNAMADILGKLNQVESGSYRKTGASASGDEVGAMHDVLAKLQEATNGAAYSVVDEGKNNPELAAAVNTSRTETGVSISRYDIRSDKKTVQEGLVKTFYSIVDNRSGKVIYSDLGLFESAMGVVKHKLYTKDDNKVQRVLDLDQEYVGAMMETYGYKRRLKQLNESSVQHDVTSAKYSNSRTKLSAAKIKLLKAL
jgi:hypothetical protein